MITLTTAVQIQSVLGANVLVGFEVLALVRATFEFDQAVGRTINATLRLRSTSAPQMEPILGSLIIRHATSEVILEFTRGAQFHRRVLLSSPQVDAVLGIFTDTQQVIEQGLVNIGIVQGAQSAGV